LEAEDFKDQMDCQMDGEDTDHEFTRKEKIEMMKEVK
jgi:hypothetical protein